MQSSRKLVIGTGGFALPEEAILSKIGIVGMSGSGKTNAARKLAEAMMDVDQHICVFDPTGAWWGLRSSADGLQPGYSIVVFGGKHADAPLRADAGTMLARSVLKERFNAIFDMSMLNDAEIRRFCTDFLNIVNLHNKHPLHLFLDEFDIICPQAKGANSEDARSAVNTTVRRTRIKGIGVTMITQNPQDADKSVLNMSDIVIAMRTQGSQASDSIKKWMGRGAPAETVNKIIATLPSLSTGSGWVWAPQIEHLGIETFLLCKTFDSGRTPKLGEKIIPPKVLAKVDIATLGAKIEAEVQEAKENDATYLKEKIRRLEAEPKSTDDTERVMGLIEEIATLKEQADKVPALESQLADYAERENSLLGKVHSIIPILQEIVQAVDVGAYPAPAAPIRPAPVPVVLAPRAEAPTLTVSEDINAPQQRILNAMATLYASRAGSVSIEWIACTAGTTPRARGFEENMRQLKAKGYVEGIKLTPAGSAIAQADATVPTFEAMLTRLSVMLPSPQIAILRQLKRGAHEPETLAQAVGTTVRARGFEENIRRLRKSEYISYAGGSYVLTPWLERLR
ncbi:MAG TPA: DUF87 domain-containing protein [Edaphobacter sp.]|nr:DUF87 domain-containing protein [Edaphobacter sp.]